MKHLAFVIYDEKAEAHMLPFFTQTKAQAIRGFSDTVNDSSNQVGKHPYDYTLFQIGEYSDREGKLTGTDKTLVGNGIEYLNKED